MENNIQKQDHAERACPFRDNENDVCTIYPVRPSICKSFMCNRNPDEINKEWNSTKGDIILNNYPLDYRTFHDLFYDDHQWDLDVKEIIRKALEERETNDK